MKMTFRKAILQAAILTLGAAALGALPATAQEPAGPPPAGPRHGGHGGRRGNQADFLTRQLNLTPDQATQVKAIDEDAWKQMKALREDTSTAGGDRRTKMMEIHKASQSNIRALLTPDQQTKFDALRTQTRERRENRGNGWGGPPPPPSTPQQ